MNKIDSFIMVQEELNKKSKLTICNTIRMVMKISITLGFLQKTNLRKLSRQRNKLIHLLNSLMKSFPISYQTITGMEYLTKIKVLIYIDPPFHGRKNIPKPQANKIHNNTIKMKYLKKNKD